ncbi:unnamed protein product [Merluccius merluccius]
MWMRPDSRSKDEFGQTVIMAQYLQVLPPEVYTWIRENSPQTGGGEEETASGSVKKEEDYGESAVSTMLKRASEVPGTLRSRRVEKRPVRMVTCSGHTTPQGEITA